MTDMDHDMTKPKHDRQDQIVTPTFKLNGSVLPL